MRSEETEEIAKKKEKGIVRERKGQGTEHEFEYDIYLHSRIKTNFIFEFYALDYSYISALYGLAR